VGNFEPSALAQRLLADLWQRPIRAKAIPKSRLQGRCHGPFAHQEGGRTHGPVTCSPNLGEGQRLSYGLPRFSNQL